MTNKSKSKKIYKTIWPKVSSTMEQLISCKSNRSQNMGKGFYTYISNDDNKIQFFLTISNFWYVVKKKKKVKLSTAVKISLLFQQKMSQIYIILILSDDISTRKIYGKAVHLTFDKKVYQIREIWPHVGNISYA